MSLTPTLAKKYELHEKADRCFVLVHKLKQKL